MNKKIILGIAFLGCSVLSLNAQEAEPEKNKLLNTFKDRKTELGLLVQVFRGSEQFSGQAMMGLQLKHWLKQHLAFRALVAYNPYTYSPKPYITPYSADSLRIQYNRSNADMVALGLGVEVQRQFYKGVLLFASLELLAGYGEGKLTGFSRIVPVEHIHYNHPGSIDLNYDDIFFRRSYTRVIPGIGAKIVFNKINFGLETQFASMGLESQRAGEKKYTIADVDVLGNIAYRLHVNYRF